MMDASPGRTRDHRIAEEQAALRRVGGCWSRAGRRRRRCSARSPRKSAAAAGSRLRDPGPVRPAGRAITIVGTWTRTGVPSPTPVGDRMPLGGRNLSTLVYQTGRPERIDYDDVSGAIGDAAAREWRLRSSGGRADPDRVGGCGAPCSWRLPARSRCRDAEARLAGFTELVATAVTPTPRRGTTSCAGSPRSRRRCGPGRRPLSRTERRRRRCFTAVAGEVGRAAGDRPGIPTWSGTTRMMSRLRSSRCTAGSATRRDRLRRGDRYELGGRNATTLVFQTGRLEARRIDGYSRAWGAVGRAAGYRSSVGVRAPISVEALGFVGASSAWRQRATSRCRADIEVRLAGFTELGRDRGRQRAGAGRTARVRRGSRRRCAGWRRLRAERRRRRCSPRSPRSGTSEGRLHGGEPVRRGRPGHGRRRLGQHRPRPPACYRPPPQTRGTEHPRACIPDGTANPDR